MRLNPELQRYGWLEFSTQRILAMPVVLGLVFFVCGQARSNVNELTAGVAVGIFMVLMVLWGGHKAAEAVIDEINDNTWDFQRLSSLSPWSLTWGKLLGSASYCWYGGLMALAVYVVAASSWMQPYYLILNAILLVVGSLLCHGVALLSSLQSAQVRATGRKKMRVVGHQILGIIAAFQFIGVLSTGHKSETMNIATWYGQVFELKIFWIAFAACLLLWTVLGIYWQMRRQLKMRTGPWLWTGFTLFIMAFVGGFASWQPLPTGAHPISLTMFAVAIFFLYVQAFIEPWNGVTYRKFFDNWRTRNLPNFFDNFPRWLASLLLAVVTGAWAVLGNADSSLAVLTLLAVLAFAFRDIALLHFFKLHPSSRRATAATVFYLAVLYILVPMVLGALDFDSGVAAFIPFGGIERVLANREDLRFISLLSGLLQAGIFLALACLRWRKYWHRKTS
jgi:hypothetical protein